MTPPHLHLLEAIPAALKDGARAVLWTLENRKGKPTKVPRVPLRPFELASVTAPDTWGSFEDAFSAVLDGKADGLGRVLGDGLAVMDLDHCRDPETGAIASEAGALIRTLNSYTEISPSGTGVHVWCKGSVPDGGRRKGPIELYDDGRYMTITGEHLEGTPQNIEERTAELRTVHASVFGLDGSNSQLQDAAVILCACRSDRGHFRELWNGEIERHENDHSRADFALCVELAYWTKRNAGWMDRLFRQSGLMRPKWDELRGTHTYGQRTIAQALSGNPRGDFPGAPTMPARSDARSPHPVLVTLADVKAEAVQWIWSGRIAAGKLTMICGDPGLGKSWITLDMAARVSNGRTWPDGTDGVAPANVLLLSAEDGLADTIRPRLERLGADLQRVRALSMVRTSDNSERGVQLSDISAIKAAITETSARLLIIDPISAYLADTDAHRDAEVRSRIAPLAALAESTGAAVVVVMHLSKSTQRPAIYRAGGSIAFAAAARVVLAAAADPDNDARRVFAPVKCNLSAPPPALTYSLSDGTLAWGSEPLGSVDIDRLLSGAPRDRGTRHEADSWLREALKDGPVNSKQIIEEAREAGFSRSTIFRAKARLGIKASRMGFGSEGGWSWRLPSPNDATPVTPELNRDTH